MKRTGIATVLVALLVVLAGCAGGAGTLTDSPQSGDATETTTSSGSSTGETGNVNFYVSDEENAIEDFEHLNVTIERVTFVRAESGGDDSVQADDESENDSDEASAEVNTSANVTATANATATVNATNETTTAENETEVEAEAEAEAEADAGAESETEAESGGQVTYEVENVTVDLTELKGDNASLVGSYEVQNGKYEKVFVHVSDVNGTLKTGEQVNIKLPSNKLQLNSEFEVGNGESTDFVFDITAFEAGKSGKYILKPVISESGTDVPIKNVDEDAEDADEKGDEEAESDDNDETEETEVEEESEETEVEANESSELNVTFDGNLTVGENVTLTVTQNGSAVENATVAINDEEVGTTDANGTLVVELPDVKEVDVKVTHGDAEAEYEFDLVVVLTETAEDDSKKPDSPGKSDNDDA